MKVLVNGTKLYGLVSNWYSYKLNELLENVLSKSYKRSEVFNNRFDSYNKCPKFLFSARMQTFVRRTLSNIPVAVEIVVSWSSVHFHKPRTTLPGIFQCL